jgi:hypothetical protein
VKQLRHLDPPLQTDVGHGLFDHIIIIPFLQMLKAAMSSSSSSSVHSTMGGAGCQLM